MQHNKIKENGTIIKKIQFQIFHFKLFVHPPGKMNKFSLFSTWVGFNFVFCYFLPRTHHPDPVWSSDQRSFIHRMTDMNCLHLISFIVWLDFYRPATHITMWTKKQKNLWIKIQLKKMKKRQFVSLTALISHVWEF